MELNLSFEYQTSSECKKIINEVNNNYSRVTIKVEDAECNPRTLKSLIKELKNLGFIYSRSGSRSWNGKLIERHIWENF